jgi:hypothetical protein
MPVVGAQATDPTVDTRSQARAGPANARQRSSADLVYERASSRADRPPPSSSLGSCSTRSQVKVYGTACPVRVTLTITAGVQLPVFPVQRSGANDAGTSWFWPTVAPGRTRAPLSSLAFLALGEADIRAVRNEQQCQRRLHRRVRGRRAAIGHLPSAGYARTTRQILVGWRCNVIIWALGTAWPAIVTLKPQASRHEAVTPMWVGRPVTGAVLGGR